MQRDDPTRTVTLHSSWTGITLAFGGTAGMVVLALIVLVNVGISIVSGLLLIAALVATGVVLFDLPVASDFSADAVVRRAPLRHQRLAWSEITRVTRARVGVVRTRHERRTGGLVAVKNGRNYLLVDRAESEREFDAVLAVLGEWRDVLVDELSLRPPSRQDPTWLYRHRRWRPGSRHDT